MQQLLEASFMANYLIGAFTKDVSLDVAKNIYLKSWESDFIYVSKAGYISEIEIKRSRADFKSDFHKCKCFSSKIDWGPGAFYKHELIKSGAYGLRTFSFMAPVGILKVEDIPDYCGFYEIDEEGEIDTLKSPVKLPNPRKITTKESQKLFEYYKYRFLNFIKEEREHGQG